MRRNTLAVLTMIALFAVPTAGFAQGKVTVDPNTLPRAEAKTPEPDPRLDQKITYDSGPKRLHAILDDIAELSGVSLISGKNKNDWRVKDIPMVICVKDMPLGKLLNAITAASHTRLGSEKTSETDPTRKYRVYRRTPDEAAIEDYIKRLEGADLARAKWQWDTVVAYGKAAELPGVPRKMHCAAKIMASFGPEAWSRLAIGETLRVTASDPLREPLIRDYYQCLWDRSIGETSSGAIKSIEEGLDSAVFQVKVTHSSIEYGFGPVRLTDERSFNDGFAFETSLLEKNGFPVPPYPESAWKPISEDEMSYPGAVFLFKGDDKWNRPLLTAKFDLTKPEDVKEPTYADLMRALAKAADCNIVVEDFYSHVGSTDDSGSPVFPSDVFRQNTSLAETLKSRPNGVPDVWFFSEADDLLIGCRYFWRESHWCLVPEALIDGLRTAYRTTGIELDAAVQTYCLPDRSSHYWIAAYKDLRFFRDSWYAIDPMWKLYNALEPSDKKLAGSESGLSLAKFDPRWIASFAADQKLRQNLDTSAFDLVLTLEEARRSSDERFLYLERALTDPTVVATMVIRVHETPTTSRIRPDAVRLDVPAEIKQRMYRMTVEYVLDGQKHTVKASGPVITFPILSPEREAELIRAAERKEKAGHTEAGK